jgi:hypothetical protein
MDPPAAARYALRPVQPAGGKGLLDRRSMPTSVLGRLCRVEPDDLVQRRGRPCAEVWGRLRVLEVDELD